jgi:hypothetical protein
MSSRKLAFSSATALAVATLVACGGGSDDAPATPVAVNVGDTVALTATGRLVSFNRTAPGTQVGAVNVSGLGEGESLLGIDRRPSDGQLYALGSGGNVYQLDPSTGVATRKSTLRAAAGDDNPFTALVGTSFGFDFNPAADRLRVVGNTGQNLRINVDNGDTTTDGNITPATAVVTASAYTNSFAGTSTTQLFNLDTTAGRLQLQDPPNNGTLNSGLPLGVTADASNGFDIDARSNIGYAALRVGGETVLYTINLTATADAATRVGVIAGGEALRGIALSSTAAPTAIALGSSNRLVAFSPRTPNTLTSNTAVTGLSAGETLVGIDVRPRDGLLWGITNTARLYTLDTTTGVATFRAALAADPADASDSYTGLVGSVTSVDFNPAADRLRVITSTGQNLRIVVETVTANNVTVTAGHTTTDGPINRASAPASVVAAAYANSFAGTTVTSLYDIEQNADQLTLQNPPNNGTLVDIGALGIDVTGAAAFDIAGGGNGLALAALRAGTAGPFALYSVSLTTGAATLYNNTSGNLGASQIGGATGPADLIDLAIRF